MASNRPEDADGVVYGRGVAFLDADAVGAARLVDSMRSMLGRLESGSVVTVRTRSDHVVEMVRDWCRSSSDQARVVQVVEAFAQHDGTTMVLRVQ